MMLELVGDFGFLFAALGMLVFTISFLVSIRWWTDLLGRVIAAVMVAFGSVISLGLAYMFELGIPGNVMWWRAVLYPLMGVTIWAGVLAFLWTQFFAPRVKRRQSPVPSTATNRRESNR